MIQEIFINCLFDLPTAKNHGENSPPKCKFKESREAAFSLLLEISKDNHENFEVFFLINFFYLKNRN